eukprot:12937069-Alexandrium_andersonii.AAC.1
MIASTPRSLAATPSQSEDEDGHAELGFEPELLLVLSELSGCSLLSSFASAAMLDALDPVASATLAPLAPLALPRPRAPLPLAAALRCRLLRVLGAEASAVLGGA